MLPRFLRPESVPYASVAIIRADGRVDVLVPAPLPVICAWCPDFDRTDPANHHASHTICAVCARQLEQGGR